MNLAHVSGRSTARPPRPTVGTLVRLVDALWLWRQRAQARRKLATLDDHMLRDIGIDRATASSEADKPFWRT